MLWRTGTEIELFTGYSVKYSPVNEPEQTVNKISGLRMRSMFREIDFTQKISWFFQLHHYCEEYLRKPDFPNALVRHCKDFASLYLSSGP